MSWLKNWRIYSAVVVLALLVVYLGYNSLLGKKDAKTILIDACRGAIASGSSESSYDIIFSVSYLTMTGKTKMWITDNDTRVDINFSSSLTGSSASRVYALKNGTFSCSLSSYYGTWTCEKINASTFPSSSSTLFGKPLSLADENCEQMTNEEIATGFLEVSDKVEKRTVANRTCNAISFVLNTTKQLPESLADDSELSQAMTTLKTAGVEKVYVTECIDVETGIALEFGMNANMTQYGSTEGFDILVTATELKNNVDIPSSVFALPAELKVYCSGFGTTVESNRCYYDAVRGEVSECEKKFDYYDVNYCIRAVYASTHDKEICSKLNSSTNKATCYNWLATELGDQSVCEMVDVSWDTLNRDECYYQLAANQSELMLCDKIVSNYTKSYCYDRLLSYVTDPQTCEKFTGIGKERCYIYVAENQGNASLCQNAGALSDVCYESVAVSTSNASICDLVSSDYAKYMCKQKVAGRGYYG